MAPKMSSLMMILLMTPMMVMSANSWFTIWVSMEINLMAITPILVGQTPNHVLNHPIKYFIIQSLGSIFLVANLIVSKQSQLNWINSNEMLLTTALILSVGAPPLHYWMPQVMKSTTTIQSWVILSIQKISPLFAISLLSLSWITALSALACIIGALGGINQSLIIIILVYSSMAHMGWMLMTTLLSEKMLTIYIIIYTLILSALLLSPPPPKKKMSQSFCAPKKTKLLFSINLLSLGGMPPLLGFILKLMAIQVVLTHMEWVLLCPLLILTSLATLAYYTMLCHEALLMNHLKKKTTQLMLKKSSFLLWWSATGPLVSMFLIIST